MASWLPVFVSEEFPLEDPPFDARGARTVDEEDREAGDIQQRELAAILDGEQTVAHVSGGVCSDEQDAAEHGNEARPETRNEGDATQQLAYPDESHEPLYGELAVEQTELLQPVLEEEESYEDAKEEVECVCTFGGESGEEHGRGGKGRPL